MHGQTKARCIARGRAHIRRRNSPVKCCSSVARRPRYRKGSKSRLREVRRSLSASLNPLAIASKELYLRLRSWGRPAFGRMMTTRREFVICCYAGRESGFIVVAQNDYVRDYHRRLWLLRRAYAIQTPIGFGNAIKRLRTSSSIYFRYLLMHTPSDNATHA